MKSRADIMSHFIKIGKVCVIVVTENLCTSGLHLECERGIDSVAVV